MLADIGENESELQRILGPHYASIVTLIRGATPTAPPVQPQNAVAGSSQSANNATYDHIHQAKKQRLLGSEDNQ